jgi:hypothetical protein
MCVESGQNSEHVLFRFNLQKVSATFKSFKTGSFREANGEFQAGVTFES